MNLISLSKEAYSSSASAMMPRFFAFKTAVALSHEFCSQVRDIYRFDNQSRGWGGRNRQSNRPSTTHLIYLLYQGRTCIFCVRKNLFQYIYPEKAVGRHAELEYRVLHSTLLYRYVPTPQYTHARRALWNVLLQLPHGVFSDLGGESSLKRYKLCILLLR